MLPELWRYRELLYFLTWRDIKVRYKQTVLGAAWAILQPVMAMVVLNIFFGELGGMNKSTDVWYPLFLYAGLLPWTFFATAVGQSANSLIGNSALLTKVYFPRLLVPAATILAALVDFAIAFGVLLVLMVWSGTKFTLGLLLVPPLMLAMVLAALAVGAFLAAATVRYRDFRYVVPFLLQMWMFASPVAYQLDQNKLLAQHHLSESWRLVYALNPVAGPILALRAAVLGEPWPGVELAISLASTVALLLLGLRYFLRVERQLADIV
ncbi:MAG: ABC transporter permease [Planctomycetes bacterium]|nr:ABC transporter permease [Planctomycetota bacterium]